MDKKSKIKSKLRLAGYNELVNEIERIDWLINIEDLDITEIIKGKGIEYSLIDCIFNKYTKIEEIILRLKILNISEEEIHQYIEDKTNGNIQSVDGQIVMRTKDNDILIFKDVNAYKNKQNIIIDLSIKLANSNKYIKIPDDKHIKLIEEGEIELEHKKLKIKQQYISYILWLEFSSYTSCNKIIADYLINNEIHHYSDGYCTVTMLNRRKEKTRTIQLNTIADCIEKVLMRDRDLEKVNRMEKVLRKQLNKISNIFRYTV